MVGKGCRPCMPGRSLLRAVNYQAWIECFLLPGYLNLSQTHVLDTISYQPKEVTGSFTRNPGMNHTRRQKPSGQRKQGPQHAEDGLTFRSGLAPQEAGVSVNVFFYIKKVGSRGEKEPRAGQNTESRVCQVRLGAGSMLSSVKVSPREARQGAAPRLVCRPVCWLPLSFHMRSFGEPWLWHRKPYPAVSETSYAEYPPQHTLANLPPCLVSSKAID